jgi:hypothetical protein
VAGCRVIDVGCTTHDAFANCQLPTVFDKTIVEDDSSCAVCRSPCALSREPCAVKGLFPIFTD